MEQITLIIAMISLGLAVAIFIGNVLNKGVSEALKLSEVSTKVALISLAVYATSFAAFLVLSNG